MKTGGLGIGCWKRSAQATENEGLNFLSIANVVHLAGTSDRGSGMACARGFLG